MGIYIKTNANITSIEARCSLTLRRHREDIGKLLDELKHGKKLTDIFKPTIANSVSKMLVAQNLIDEKGIVTPTGEQFIDYPYNKENENGIYNVLLADLKLGNDDIRFIPFVERKLSNEDREKKPVSFVGMYGYNEFRIGSREEKGVMFNIKATSDGYVSSLGGREIVFDVTDGKYDAGYGSLLSGENINSIALEYVETKIPQLNPDFGYSNQGGCIIAKGFSSLTDKEIKCGKILSRVFGDITVQDVPFMVTNVEDGQKYAYLFMYYLLCDDKYYSLTEMNEIFFNEILSQNVIPDGIKSKFIDFTYSIDGFKKYLPKDKFDNLSYRLNIVKTLLDIDNFQDEYGFSKTRNYAQFTNKLSSIASPFDVQRLYLVTGYAFAKTLKNKMVECCQNLKAAYNNVIIVNKLPDSRVRNDQDIIDEIARIGVKTINKPDIADVFHDRLIIFELKDGTYKSLLCTCEVGQFYNQETYEPMGSVIEIQNSELTKNGKNIISVIKE